MKSNLLDLRVEGLAWLKKEWVGLALFWFKKVWLVLVWLGLREKTLFLV